MFNNKRITELEQLVRYLSRRIETLEDSSRMPIPKLRSESEYCGYPEFPINLVVSAILKHLGLKLTYREAEAVLVSSKQPADEPGEPE